MMGTMSSCDECGARRAVKNLMQIWMHGCHCCMDVCQDCYEYKTVENVEAMADDIVNAAAHLNAIGGERAKASVNQIRCIVAAIEI